MNIEIEEIKSNLIKKLELAKHNVYTKVNTVSKSGMSRTIDFYISTKAGYIYCINWELEQLEIGKRAKNDAIRVHGCGMNMCWHTVLQLSQLLYNEENKLKYQSL